MSERRLYVSDLDGTLLNDNAELSARTYAILNDLLRKGLPFTVATARTYCTTLSILRGLPITLPMILQNGALLYDGAAKRIIHAETIESAQFLNVCDAMREQGVHGFVYCAEDDDLRCCYQTLANDFMRQFYEERRDRYAKPFYQVESLAALRGHSPVYVTMRAPQNVLQPVVELLKSTQGLTLSYYRDVYLADVWYLEISAEKANKCEGIRRIQAMYGFDAVTGFGDNANDLPLFAACDRKIAVANAAEVLKSQADAVIGKNTEDAVAEYLLENTH